MSIASSLSKCNYCNGYFMAFVIEVLTVYWRDEVLFNVKLVIDICWVI